VVAIRSEATFGGRRTVEALLTWLSSWRSFRSTLDVRRLRSAKTRLISSCIEKEQRQIDNMTRVIEFQSSLVMRKMENIISSLSEQKQLEEVLKSHYYLEQVFITAKYIERNLYLKRQQWTINLLKEETIFIPGLQVDADDCGNGKEFYNMYLFKGVIHVLQAMSEVEWMPALRLIIVGDYAEFHISLDSLMSSNNELPFATGLLGEKLLELSGAKIYIKDGLNINTWIISYNYRMDESNYFDERYDCGEEITTPKSVASSMAELLNTKQLDILEKQRSEVSVSDNIGKPMVHSFRGMLGASKIASRLK
jgi:hypothetical protein